MSMMDKIIRQVGYLLRPIEVKIANLITRGVVTSVNDGEKMQRLTAKIGADRPADDGERFQQYGFSSVPLGGSEAIVVHQNGNAKHPIVIATDDRRYRPTGKNGGHVCIYHHTGAIVEFTDSGDVVVTPASGRNILLGSTSASDGVIKGSSRDTIEQTFLTAMGVFANACTTTPPSAASTFAAAVTTFQNALGGTISSKTKTV